MFIVLTGAPSSGKTTLVNALEALGFKVMLEAAREVLQIPGLKENDEALQIEIESRQIQRESLPITDLTFLDRGLPDSLAYRRLNGFIETELLSKINPSKYSLVFLCRFGRHFDDGVRDNDTTRSVKIEKLLRDVYIELGCQVIDLPWIDSVPVNIGVLKRLEIISRYL